MGFTLIELMVVISIISLLSSIVLKSLNSAKAKARDALRIRNIEEMHVAIELYLTQNGFPPDPNPGSYVYDWDTFGWPALATMLNPYIKSLPKDPCGEKCPGASANNIFYAYEYEPPSFLIGRNGDPEPFKPTSYIVQAIHLEGSGGRFGFGFSAPGNSY